MDCVSCGLVIDPDEPWWAVYAWDAFDLKQLDAMAMHEACFTAGETIEAAWWVTDPETGESHLHTESQLRLLRAPGAGTFVWSIHPDTGEGFLAQWVPTARAQALDG